MRRSESIARTGLWPYGGVPYNQGRRWNGKARQDCSGWVSLLWDLAMDAAGSWGGYSTVSLLSEGMMHEIAASELRPADAIGICGPGSGGNAGHIMWFEAWYNNDPNDNRCWIWEQAGGGNGPRRRLIEYPGLPYRSYRRTEMEDDPAGSGSLHRAWPSYLPENEYFGDINGPDQSHGGYYAREQSDVRAIQQRLNDMGYDAGPIDGIFGPRTGNAVKRWQAALYANLTSRYGEVWSDDWDRMFTY